jgi:hypothetical protein
LTKQKLTKKELLLGRIVLGKNCHRRIVWGRIDSNSKKKQYKPDFLLIHESTKQNYLVLNRYFGIIAQNIKRKDLPKKLNCKVMVCEGQTNQT